VTAFDNLTAEMFQSEWMELRQISPATISAAFKKENKHITCTIPLILDSLHRIEKAIIITISVDFDFLPKINEAF
jgi:RecA-family ATPase